MTVHMRDSRLNGTERALQHSFRKFRIFNSLLMAAAVLAAFIPIRELPDRRSQPPKVVPLSYRPVPLDPKEGPLRLAGAWVLEAKDRRVGGLSALVIDAGQFVAVSDRGAVVRFDPPSADRPTAAVKDLGDGPGPADARWSRDAESLARDPRGRGWWVGYEQRHSLWLYDARFARAIATVDLKEQDWHYNRGAEGLLAARDGLLVLAENGRDALSVGTGGVSAARLDAGADVADAALAPDGSAWLLLRSKGVSGISQSIVPILRDRRGYRSGRPIALPKGAFDNYEGMAIASLAGGGWRIWLVTDDGHRVMARTLLVALDLAEVPRHGKSPAVGAGLSKKPSVEMP